MNIRNLLVAMICSLSACQSENTIFRGQNYEITLPGKWIDDSEMDVISYKSNSGREQITIGYYPLKKQVSETELQSLVEIMTDNYRKAELQEISQLVLGESTFSTWRAYLRADYFGIVPADHREVVRTLIATSAFIFTLFYESVEKSNGGFKVKYNGIIEALKFK